LFTSKEDHTYVTGEIYQRVIAIRKSKKDSKGRKGQKRSSRIYEDTFSPSPLKLVVNLRIAITL
jgi:hypothetical protein